MTDILPKDLWSDIFLRLPVKTLVICACTCKTFNSYITNPNFVASHLKRSKENPVFFLRYYIDSEAKGEEGDNNELFGLHPDDESLNWGFNMRKLPFKTHARCFHILGSCNGVICLSDDVEGYTSKIYLWNPSIRKYILLPWPNVTFSKHGAYDMCLGFGFDELANDFKVIRVVYLENYYDYVYPPLVELYSVKSGSWRYVENSSPELLIYDASYSQCLFNGAIHWFGEGRRPPRSPYMLAGIVTFNVADESFGVMKLPSSLDCFSSSYVRGNLTISTCWGMLAIIHLLSGKLCIWVMKEYGVVDSWNQMFTFINPMIPINPRFRGPIFKPITFRKNKDILMLRSKDRMFKKRPCHVIHSVKQDGSMLEELGTYFGSLGGFYLDLYEESLSLFNEGKPTSSDDEDAQDDKVVQNDEPTHDDEAEELERRFAAIWNLVRSGNVEVSTVLHFNEGKPTSSDDEDAQDDNVVQNDELTHGS